MGGTCRQTGRQALGEGPVGQSVGTLEKKMAVKVMLLTLTSIPIQSPTAGMIHSFLDELANGALPQTDRQTDS